MTSSRFKIYTQTLLHHLRAAAARKVVWHLTLWPGFLNFVQKNEGFLSETVLDDEPV